MLSALGEAGDSCSHARAHSVFCARLVGLAAGAPEENPMPTV